MSTVSLGPAEPASSTEIEISDQERWEDVDRKHSRVAEFLEVHGYDALLLQKPANFAWFTSGGDSSRRGSSQTTANLFVTPEARLVLTANVDTPHIFDRELPGLGFQLKERPWYEPRHLLIEDLCRGRTVASDTGTTGTEDASVHLTHLRLPLTGLDRDRTRVVGRLVTHAVEATARHLAQGQSEAEIAGEVAHRLVKRRLIPERIQVWADNQNERYRHWSYGTDRVERTCVISAVARRWGLCAGAARACSFGGPPDEFRSAYHRAALVQATGLYFSRPEWELFEIWDRVKRIYDKFGCTNEWQLADQAAIIGFEACEIPVVPRSEFRLAPGMAVHWYPSVGPATVGDTVLVEDEGPELVTPMENWPRLTVSVKGTSLYRPDILLREESA